ncbi:MAG: hypothetical protein HKP58_01530 [Desulfatitalea sp.]|nr:hypothetical protein [Desulfatitalea sp.]NNJ99068.1 hypothetical protein [Desulfatitalea sp.]
MANWKRARRMFLFAALSMGLLAADAFAGKFGFHGYFESNLRLRDTNGAQYGFFDNTELIQQRNTLKFDVDAMPEDLAYHFGDSSISLEKFHFTYRGAYDTVFELRKEEYNNIARDVVGRYNYGLNDIRSENDLREAFFDLVYDGAMGYSYLRSGRQLVGWGETSIGGLCDVINPMDISHEQFFVNPDDLKIPLWMVRYNHSLPPAPNLVVSFDVVYNPDVRPWQMIAESSMSAPYAPAPAFAPYNIAITHGFEDKDPEVSAKLSATLFQYYDISLVYHDGIYQKGSFAFNPPIPGQGLSAVIEHPRIKTYGGYFSIYSPPVDCVFKGEFSRTENEPVWRSQTALLDLSHFIIRPDGTIPVYSPRAVDRAMIGVDKNVWMRWLSASQVNLGLEYIHTHIEDFDEAIFGESPNAVEDSGLFTFLANWYWLHGNINPMLVLWYHTEGVYSTRLDVRYNINMSFYVKGATQIFLGDPDAQTDYSHSIMANQVRQTEVSFLFGFQW